MNFASIVVGVALVIVLVFAIGFMNRGNGPCGGNCSTCAMSEHCEKQFDKTVKDTKEKKEGTEE